MRLAQVFYMFGAGGLVWAAGWEAMMGGIEAADPATARLLEGEDARHTSSPTRAGAGGGGGNAMPWRGMLRNTPVRALAYTHFCNNWCALLPAARRAPRACSSEGKCAMRLMSTSSLMSLCCALLPLIFHLRGKCP